jgi:hypothetical protein
MPEASNELPEVSNDLPGMLASKDGVEGIQSSIQRIDSMTDADEAALIPTSTPDDASQQRRTTARRVLTFVGLQLTLFLASLDGSV